MEELPRHIAPGGIGRMVIGFACGLVAGAIIALVLPRDDGPRRRSLRLDPVLTDVLDPDADPGELRRG